MKPSVEEIKGLIKQTGASVNIAEIDLDDDLSSAGLDSLEMFNLLLNLEENYGVTIPEEDIDKVNSIGAIMRYLEASGI